MRSWWVGSLAAAVMIAMLFFAGSMRVRAENDGVNNHNDQAAATAADVRIDNFSFAPQTLTVAAGTTITWTNRDD
ncbi:MAG: hypothetical protein WCA97_15165, partial [Terriglobales bacterium]